MLSMTGFGKGEAVFQNDCFFSVEISSVNRKQLELRCTLPAELAEYENIARRLVGGAVSRGAIQLRCSVRYANSGTVGVEVDSDLLRSLIRNAVELRREFGLPVGEVNAEQFFSVPGVLKSRTLEADAQGVREAFEVAISAAIGSFQQMRRCEGEALRGELESRISGLEELLKRIEPFAAAVPEAARKRLEAKLLAAKPPIPVEPEQFAREMLFYLDKSDVSEEVTRLKSHFRQFRLFLASSEPVGRSMDFLMQEFFREITTLGNKAATPELSPLTVAFKAELEKIREQIQNVE